MTREELDRYAARLEETGLRFATRQRDDSGNVQRMQEIPWDQAIAHILSQTGWAMVEEDREPTEVTPLRVVD